MNTATRVYCLNQPERETVYQLPPRRAVFAAYQASLKKHNTWQYERDIERNPPIRTRCGWTVGGFWARDEELPGRLFRQREML